MATNNTGKMETKMRKYPAIFSAPKVIESSAWSNAKHAFICGSSKDQEMRATKEMGKKSRRVLLLP